MPSPRREHHRWRFFFFEQLEERKANENPCPLLEAPENQLEGSLACTRSALKEFLKLLHLHNLWQTWLPFPPAARMRRDLSQSCRNLVLLCQRQPSAVVSCSSKRRNLSRLSCTAGSFAKPPIEVPRNHCQISSRKLRSQFLFRLCPTLDDAFDAYEQSIRNRLFPQSLV